MNTVFWPSANAFVGLVLILVLNASLVAQQREVTTLVHPEVADRMSLDDGQRSQIQSLLQERNLALAEAEDDSTRSSIRDDYREKILEVLSPQQLERFRADAEPNRLMFQFREMKWEDVLEWFAQQQDLTLVMDRTPPGTFTYSDTRSYSPAEGIDLLNSVLMTRNFTLVRRQKMLVVMELSDSLPLELIPRVELSELAERGRFELVSVSFELGGRPVDAVLKEVQPYLSNFGRAVPLARGSQLLVVDTAGKMRTINELIASVPVPKEPKKEKPEPPPKPVFAAYPLQGLDPSTVMETISKLISSDQITVDPQTGVLSAYVVPGQQTAIQSAINQMTESRGELAESASAAFSYSGIEPETLRAQVRELLPNATVTVTVDRVLVTATADELPKIETAMKSLNLQPVGGSQSIRSFALPDRDASEVTDALRSFLPSSQFAANPEAGSLIARGSEEDLRVAENVLEIWRVSRQQRRAQLRAFDLQRQATEEWLGTVSEIVPEARTWLSDQGQTLMVMATEDDLKLLEEALPELTSALPESDQQQLKIYRLTKHQRLRRATLEGELPGSLEGLRMTTGGDPSELLVWATAEQHTRFNELLESLDQPLPSDGSKLPRKHALSVEDTQLVMEILADEFPDAEFRINSANDQLTVVANEPLQQEIATRVSVFNEQLPAREEDRLESYSLPGMTPSELESALEPLLADTRTSIDASKSRLLVWTDAENHRRLSELVATLGEEPEVDQQRVVMAYSLENVSAETAKQVIDQIISGAEVLADERLQQIVVTGNLQNQSVVKSTLAQIDHPSAGGGKRQLRSYDVGELDAINLVDTLETMWPEMEITADSTANKIVASGSERDQQSLAQAIERLMVAPDGEQQSVETYAVPQGEMSTLPAVLSQLAPRAVISSDPTSRTITVWAGPEQQTRVKQAIEQIAEAAKSNKVTATYTVKSSQLSGVQSSIRALFPTVNMATESTSGQVIVIAAEDVQTQIQDVVRMLSEGPNAADRTSRVFEIDVERISVNDLLYALEETAPEQVRLQANTSNGTILAIGLPEEIEQVAQQIDELQTQMPPVEESVSAVYRLEHGDSEAAMSILASLVPRATLAEDATANTIAATAVEKDQRKIEDFIQAYDVPATSNLETRVYHLDQRSAQGPAAVLQALIPEASIHGAADSGVMVATATEQQHARITTVLDDYDRGREGRETRVFSAGRSDARSLERALADLIPDASVTSDRDSNNLIVTAASEQLERVAKIVEDIAAGGGTDTVTRYYALKSSDPRALSESLSESFPDATITADRINDGVYAAASADEHEKIAEIVANVNEQPSGLRQLRAFVLEHARPEAAAEALDDAYGRRSTAGVSFDRESRSLFVVGTEEQLAIADQLVEQFDQAPSGRSDRQMQAFALKGADGDSVTEAVEALFEGSGAEVDIRYDSRNEQLLVTADSQQLKQVQETLKQFEPPERDLRIVRLNRLDPYSFQMAVDSLFEDQPERMSPSLTIDYSDQQVIVRATPEQLEQIDQLLEQMGEMESGIARRSSSDDIRRSSRLRTLPVNRNPERMFRDLQRLWPSLRDNPLRLVDPQRLMQESSGSPASSESEDSERKPQAGDENQSQDVSSNAWRGSNGSLGILTSTQRSANSQQVDEANDDDDSHGSASPESEASPIVIVTGEDQWMLASEDQAALEQFQQLWEAMNRTAIEPFAAVGNYSVYVLRHAGAEEMESLLSSLFGTGSRNRSSSSILDSLQRVRFAADPRTNTLIMNGSRSDREVVEELLGVLDSEEFVDTLQQVSPTMVRLDNASAENVGDIIEDVYRSQLTSGAGRPPLPIPEGVSSEVATALRQINAQASGPLLTLSIDESTNSIVMRAPNELGGEIRDFIEQLDQQAKTSPARRMRLIQLQSTNADSLQQALQILMSR